MGRRVAPHRSPRCRASRPGAGSRLEVLLVLALLPDAEADDAAGHDAAVRHDVADLRLQRARRASQLQAADSGPGLSAGEREKRFDEALNRFVHEVGLAS